MRRVLKAMAMAGVLGAGVLGGGAAPARAHDFPGGGYGGPGGYGFAQGGCYPHYPGPYPGGGCSPYPRPYPGGGCSPYPRPYPGGGGFPRYPSPKPGCPAGGWGGYGGGWRPW